MIGPRASTRRRHFAGSFADAFIFSVHGGPTAPGEARRELGERIGGHVGVQAIETARLLLSELVTNCVKHGQTSRDRGIEVSGTLLERTLRVEVSGDGPAFEHEPQRPDAETAGGRGLYLVEALSETWGISRSRRRTAVWFEIVRDQPGA